MLTLKYTICQKSGITFIIITINHYSKFTANLKYNKSPQTVLHIQIGVIYLLCLIRIFSIVLYY